MEIIRRFLEESYLLFKPLIFAATKNNPEIAHNFIINKANYLNEKNLDKFLFDCSVNKKYSGLELSPAAGFNKNGDIHPLFLKYLGFERVVVGTVTHDFWEGNPKPSIMRYPESESLVNWMGLPGKGSKRVAEKLQSYGNYNVPLTINLMSTPQKQGKELMKDLEGTVLDLRDIKGVDRFELNISCPNTHNKSGKMDSRSEYQEQIGEMLYTLRKLILPSQELYLKVSPDLDIEGVEEIISVIKEHTIKGIVSTNTTTNHDPRYIADSPGKGGASGNAVYESSLKVQKMFNKLKDNNLKIIACGGIDSIERLNERLNNGAIEIQIYTPLIFKGPKLLRKLKDR
jgi:dihydroorotate dehydrogenase